MSIFGKAFGKRDDEYHKDYQHDIERMRREHEEHLKQVQYDQQRRMNSAQNYASGGYQSGWQDPRAARLTGATPISPEEALVDSLAETNRVMKRLHEKIDRTEKKVEMLSGFYTWITEVYPEIAAQHKAMRDLYEAANSNEMKTEAGP